MSTDNNFKLYEGKEIEIGVRQGAEYNGVKPTYFNLPTFTKEKSDSSTPKDYVFYKRKTALECASRVHAGETVDPAAIITTADDFLNWLNK